MRKDKLVKIALLFGRGQTHVGVLIFPSVNMDNHSGPTPEDILDKLWYAAVFLFASNR